MTRTCPDCGSAVEYASRTALVLEGSCSGCGHVLTVMQNLPDGTPAPAGDGADASSGKGRASARGEAGGWSGPRPTCVTCGAAMTFHAAGEGIQGVCSGCGLASGYVPEGSSGPESRPRRPPRFEPSGEDRGGFGPARARPCRECGGPLRFSTAPDGTISGECGSCGNRFTLPPRRDGPGGRGDSGGRRFDRGSGPRFGRGGPPRRYGRPSGAGFRPRERREDRDDEGDERPRRRPRRE